MAYCILYQDWPNRVKLAEDGVVHAARPFGSRPYDKYYRDHGFSVCIACISSWRMEKHVKQFIEVDNNPTIPCKNCLRALGDRPEISERFLIMNKDGLYLKKGGRLTEEVADAKLFRTKGTAKNWMGVTVYFDGFGNEISWREYMALGRDRMPRETKTRLKEGYRIL